MIFKVFFQEVRTEVPVREKTQTLYMTANTEAEVRNFLNDRNYNIEFVQQLSEAHLAYEQENPDFNSKFVERA
ncbi:MAG: DNA-dependent RNA polymerase subunit epsilon [Bacilli bacterium]